MVLECADKLFWTEFLVLYKSLPALWKVNSVDYRNKELRDEAYEKLVSKLQRAIPSADRYFATKKINSFRTNNCKELAKVKKARAKGENYVPHLWYYPLMDFLRKQNNNSSTSDSENEENPMQSMEEVNVDFQPSAKKIKVERMSDDEQPYTISSVIEPHIKLEESYFNGNTELETIARCWDMEFNKLTAEQRMYAKKAIDDVLFEGRLGLLTKNSVAINSVAITPSR